MPKLLALIGSVLLTTAVSVVACANGAQEPKRDNDASAFAREVVGVLAQIERAHNALSDSGPENLSASQREARYRDLEAEMRLARGRIGAAEAPVELQQARALFTELLIAERDIWVHMVLFARTGQELHRILANELLIDNEERSRAAVLRLQRDLDELGIDPEKVGLEAYPAADGQTPIAALATPTDSPVPSPSASPVPPSTPSPTPAADPESRPVVIAVPTSTRVPQVTATPTSRPNAAQTATPTSLTAPRAESTQAPTPRLTPTATAASTATATATGTPSPTPSPVPSPTPESTHSLVPTPTAVPSSPPTPTAVPPASPTPLPTPAPVLPVLKEGELVVIRWPDRRGNSAFIAHWTVDVEARTLAVVEYPFVAGDNLEISMFLGIDELGSTLSRAYIEAPNGERLVELSDFAKTWNGEATTAVDGTYRVYFDNTDSDVPKDMHVLITYHTPAPGSKVPR